MHFKNSEKKPDNGQRSEQTDGLDEFYLLQFFPASGTDSPRTQHSATRAKGTRQL
jgi:hypothetical protein